MSLESKIFLKFTKEEFLRTESACKTAFADNEAVLILMNVLEKLLFAGKDEWSYWDEGKWSYSDDLELAYLPACGFKILAAHVSTEMIKSAEKSSIYSCSCSEAFVNAIIADRLENPKDSKLGEKVKALKAWCEFWKIPLADKVDLKKLWRGEVNLEKLWRG